MADTNNPEYLANVLAITRDQLNRAMSVSAELEAALYQERSKVQELEKQLAEAKKSTKE
jgi:hypothetical protein